MPTHRLTLNAIKGSGAGRQVAAPNEDPKIACRREFRRAATNQKVHFSLHDPKFGRVAKGTATLVEYSPSGALLEQVRFAEGFWPDGEFEVSFRITGGEFEGVSAYGRPVRFTSSAANLAVRFDGLYVKL